MFDQEFHNSVVYGAEPDYRIRSANSEWRFTYSGTYLAIRAKPTLMSIPGFECHSVVTILIGGSVWRRVHVPDERLVELELPSGLKEVVLIEPLLSRPGGFIGTFLTDVVLDADAFEKTPVHQVPEKLVFLGDSITVGANAEYPSTQGYAQLFRTGRGKEVGVLGYGYGQLLDFAGSPEKLDTTLGHISSLFANVTMSKKLVIALGTNDYGLSSTPADRYASWYADLLDAVHGADGEIEVFCVSPLSRANEGRLPADYRSALESLCATRPFASYIDGADILSTDDLVDGVHPGTAGHAKYHEALGRVIYG